MLVIFSFLTCTHWTLHSAALLFRENTIFSSNLGVTLFKGSHRVQKLDCKSSITLVWQQHSPCLSTGSHIWTNIWQQVSAEKFLHSPPCFWARRHHLQGWCAVVYFASSDLRVMQEKAAQLKMDGLLWDPHRPWRANYRDIRWQRIPQWK